MNTTSKTEDEKFKLEELIVEVRRKPEIVETKDRRL